VDVLLGNETYGIGGQLPEQLQPCLPPRRRWRFVDRFERDLAESRAIVTSSRQNHRANKWRYRQIGQQLVGFAFTLRSYRPGQATVHAVRGK